MSAESAEKCRVVAYQNQLDRTPLAHGVSRNDIFIAGTKVTLPAGEGGAVQTLAPDEREFVFESVFGPENLPVAVARAAVPAAVDGVLSGVNQVLIMLGASGSGKAELLEGTAPSGGGERWEGLAELLIKALYSGVRDATEGGAAGTTFRIQLQFLHIVEERVQDLLEPDCHTHDHELVEEEGGIVVRDAEPEDLKGEAHAVGLYRQGIQSLHSLARYHEVDLEAACSVLTLTVAQRTLLGGGYGGEADGYGESAVSSSRIASLSIVCLPGTERLCRAQYEMQITEGAFKHRSITQFGDLVKALSRRANRTYHVPWHSGKLVRLVGERLGGNARVQAIATLKAGQRDESRATLKCAAELRRVLQYPLVNTELARGLLAIRRAELQALRKDLQAMQLQGVPPPPQPTMPEHAEPPPPPAAPPARARTPSDAGGGEGEEAQEEAAPASTLQPLDFSGLAAGATAGEGRLAQSERMGQQLQAEVLQARLKEYKASAKREKDRLNDAIRALEEQVTQLRREKLEQESEKLRAAKALVELEVDGQSLVDAKDEELAQVEARLDESLAQREAAEAETRRVRGELRALQAALDAEVAKREHAEDEVLAARYTLEQLQVDSAGWAADKGDLEAEVVSSVNQASSREIQLKEVVSSLTKARAELEASRAELHAEQAKGDGLAANLAAAKRAHTEATARASALEVELRRANVQNEMAAVLLSKERVELHDRLQQREAAAAAAAREREAAEAVALSERTDSGRSVGAGRAAQALRAELSEARAVATEEAARADALEHEAAAAEAKARRAQSDYRSMVEKQLDQQSSTYQQASGRSAVPVLSLVAGLAPLEGAIASLHAALLADARAGERDAEERLASLRARHARSQASFRQQRSSATDGSAKSRAGQGAEEGALGGGGGKLGGGPAELHAELQVELQAELAEARRIAEQLGREKAALSAKLEEAAATYTTALGQLRKCRSAIVTPAPSAAATQPESRRPDSQQEARLSAVSLEAEPKQEVQRWERPPPERDKRQNEEQLRAARRDEELMQAVRRLALEKEVLQKQLEMRTAGAAEVRRLSEELDRLKGERGDFKQDYDAIRANKNLQVQTREMAQNIAALESERSKLIRRAASAEEQLKALQESMSANILTYQKEIIRLRRMLQERAKVPPQQQQRPL